MRRLAGTLRFIAGHPLNRAHPVRALVRYLAWQVGSRLVPGPVAVPFVGATRLLVRRGMAGATGNLYAGLAEFEEMGFVLHALRAGDLFVDVGANVGAYTVLACGACGASGVAIEAVPKTFEGLLDNIRLNRLEERVRALPVAAAAERGVLTLAADRDTVNHVLAPGETAPREAATVPADTLDALLAGREPSVIKIDVEGYEAQVVRGAASALSSPALLAVVMELNGSGSRYGFEDARVCDGMRAKGFAACRYDPFTRTLTRVAPGKGAAWNAIFVRNETALAERLTRAPRRVVHGVEI